jgi:Dolichyl-phosphate-mannose-protein mannosyltransferase/Protein of unknown function (DUF1420)
MPPIVLGSAALIGLLVLAAALGRRLLRWLQAETADPLEHGVVAAGLGLGALTFLPFTLFALGIGSPLVMRLTLLLLGAALVPDVIAVVHAAWRWFSVRRPLAWWQASIAAAFALLLSAVYLRALCPVSDVDGLVYHVTAPVRFLRAGRFEYLPTLTFTNWPLGTEMLFALLLAVHPALPGSLVSFAAGLLILGAVYLYGRRLGDPFIAMVAPSLLLLVPIFWEEMTYALIDLGTSLFATLAAYAYASATRRPRWLVVSALFAGFAAATKMNCALAIGIIPFLMVLEGRGSRASVGAAVRYGLVAVAILLPWIGRTWVLTGNPVYPLFHGIFAGYEWTADGWTRLRDGHWVFNVPRYLTPTALVTAGSHAAIVAAFAGVSLLVIRLTRKSAVAQPARFASLFGACVCISSHYDFRFLLGAVPCVAVCVALLFRGRERLLAPFLCAGAAAVALFLTWQLKDVDLGTAVAVASGTMSPEDYLRERLPDYPVVQFANQHLPRNAKVVVSMLASRTALYENEALIANYWLQDSIHYDSDERLESDLRRLGVTHLVLTPEFPAWVDTSNHHGPRNGIERASLCRLAERRGVELFEANGVVLYRLQLPAAPDACSAAR